MKIKIQRTSRLNQQRKKHHVESSKENDQIHSLNHTRAEICQFAIWVEIQGDTI